MSDRRNVVPPKNTTPKKNEEQRNGTSHSHRHGRRRKHKKLFREYSATALHFTVTEANEVAIFMKVKKVSTFLEQMAAPATAEAMAGDGVKRETVRIFVLDKEVEL